MIGAKPAITAIRANVRAGRSAIALWVSTADAYLQRDKSGAILAASLVSVAASGRCLENVLEPHSLKETSFVPLRAKSEVAGAGSAPGNQLSNRHSTTSISGTLMPDGAGPCLLG